MRTYINKNHQLYIYNLFQVNAHINVDTKHQTMSGVAFPITQEAMDRMRDLQAGALTYVQLVRDLND